MVADSSGTGGGWRVGAGWMESRGAVADGEWGATTDRVWSWTFWLCVWVGLCCMVGQHKKRSAGYSPLWREHQTKARGFTLLRCKREFSQIVLLAVQIFWREQLFP